MTEKDYVISDDLIDAATEAIGDTLRLVADELQRQRTGDTL